MAKVVNMLKLQNCSIKQKQYDVAEAIDILKKMDTAKFDETVELAVNLNVDQKYADQQVRGAL